MSDIIEGHAANLDALALREFDGALIVVVNDDVDALPSDRDVLLYDKTNKKVFVNGEAIRILNGKNLTKTLGSMPTAPVSKKNRPTYDLETENLVQEGRLKMALLINTCGGDCRAAGRVGRARDEIIDRKGTVHSFVGHVAYSAGADFATLAPPKNRFSLSNAEYLWHTRDGEAEYKERDRAQIIGLFNRETKKKHRKESAEYVQKGLESDGDVCLPAETLKAWGMVHALFKDPDALEKWFIKEIGILPSLSKLRLTGSIPRFFTLLDLERRIHEKFGVRVVLETEGTNINPYVPSKNVSEEKIREASEYGHALIQELRKKDDEQVIQMKNLLKLFGKK